MRQCFFDQLEKIPSLEFFKTYIVIHWWINTCRHLLLKSRHSKGSDNIKLPTIFLIHPFITPFAILLHTVPLLLWLKPQIHGRIHGKRIEQSVVPWVWNGRADQWPTTWAVAAHAKFKVLSIWKKIQTYLPGTRTVAHFRCLEFAWFSTTTWTAPVKPWVTHIFNRILSYLQWRQFTKDLQRLYQPGIRARHHLQNELNALAVLDDGGEGSIIFLTPYLFFFNFDNNK